MIRCLLLLLSLHSAWITSGQCQSDDSESSRGQEPASDTNWNKVTVVVHHPGGKAVELDPIDSQAHRTAALLSMLFPVVLNLPTACLREWNHHFVVGSDSGVDFMARTVEQLRKQEAESGLIEDPEWSTIRRTVRELVSELGSARPSSDRLEHIQSSLATTRTRAVDGRLRAISLLLAIGLYLSPRFRTDESDARARDLLAAAADDAAEPGLTAGLEWYRAETQWKENRQEKAQASESRCIAATRESGLYYPGMMPRPRSHPESIPWSPDGDKK